MKPRAKHKHPPTYTLDSDTLDVVYARWRTSLPPRAELEGYDKFANYTTLLFCRRHDGKLFNATPAGLYESPEQALRLHNWSFGIPLFLIDLLAPPHRAILVIRRTLSLEPRADNRDWLDIDLPTSVLYPTDLFQQIAHDRL